MTALWEMALCLGEERGPILATQPERGRAGFKPSGTECVGYTEGVLGPAKSSKAGLRCKRVSIDKAENTGQWGGDD